MNATYALTEEEEDALKKDFPNFYCRMRELWETLVCFVRKGSLCGMVSANSDVSGIPTFVSVTFPVERASSYERQFEKYLSRRLRNLKPLPRPTFTVEILIDYYGILKSTTFSFRNYGEESLRAFCEGVRTQIFMIQSETMAQFRARRQGEKL